MKTKITIMITAASLLWLVGPAQVSINTNGASPDGSSMLDVNSTTRGILIPRMTTNQRDAIASPAIGLVIFNSTTDCIELYNLSGWWSLCSSHSMPTGVTAVPSPNPVCAGNTLTLTGSATGATLWNWVGPNGFTSSLQSPTIPGITSAGAGVFTLTASNAAGSAASVSTSSVTVNNVPEVAGTITGTANVNQGQTGVAYSIIAVSGATGYTWNYTGTGFTIATGANTNSILADFSGTATSGNLTVTPTNSCGDGTTSPIFSINMGVLTCGGSYTYNTVSTAGYTWLDRNLGASRVATASNDYMSFGSLYQWGRQSDGHQCITWTSSTTGTPQNGTTSTQCSSGTCPDALFVTIIGDWNNPSSNTLWNGATKGANDPCPSGYRVPSNSELLVLKSSFSPNNATGAYNSPVKMPAAGGRSYSSGNPGGAGSSGCYWSSTFNDSGSAYPMIFSGSKITNDRRAYGYSVRCIAQ